MTAALVPMGELEKMAKVVVSSRLFGVETIEQAMTLMLLCQAENVHPMIALRDYHIVEGKPALKADAMLARFQAGGGKVEWQEYTDTKVSAYFSHPGSPKPVLIEWSLESAAKVSVWSKKKNGWEPLTNKHTWKSYPRQMLKARVISEGVRATNPGVAVGIYTVEETQDFTEPRQEKNITPSAGVEEKLTDEEMVRADEVAVKMSDWLKQGSLGDAVYELENAALNAEQTIYLWTHFEATPRRLMKKEQERIRKAAAEKARGMQNVPYVAGPEAAQGEPVMADTITDAARKRLEARISETKIDRDTVKQYIGIAFGRAHFSELTKEEYRIVDGFVELTASATLDELAATWKTLSKDDRITLTAAKDRRKQELEKQGEAV